MDYKLVITQRAEELLDQCLYYILYQLKNEQAAKYLLDEIDKRYDRFENNPYQFPDCRDNFLKSKGYKEAVVLDMNYIIIFRIEEETVYVHAIFHQLENYKEKM